MKSQWLVMTPQKFMKIPTLHNEAYLRPYIHPPLDSLIVAGLLYSTRGGDAASTLVTIIHLHVLMQTHSLLMSWCITRAACSWVPSIFIKVDNRRSSFSFLMFQKRFREWSGRLHSSVWAKNKSHWASSLKAMRHSHSNKEHQFGGDHCIVQYH